MQGEVLFKKKTSDTVEGYHSECNQELSPMVRVKNRLPRIHKQVLEVGYSGKDQLKLQ